MKLKLIILPLCLIALHAFGFEGTIKQTIKNYKGSGNSVSMTWYLGANHCRIDMAISGKDAASNNVLIMDPASSTIKMYNTSGSAAEKVYFQINPSAISGSMTILSVTPTTETKEINGYKCEKWTVITSTGGYTLWVARDIDFDWAAYKDLMKSSVEVQALASQGLKGFPMLIESTNGGNTAAVESVTAAPQSATMFSVPSEYKLFAPQAPAPKTK